MKRFMIKYHRTVGTQKEWHQEIARFIAALDEDTELNGRISYRCMKARDGDDYYHLVLAEDDAVPVLQGRDYFKHYTDETKRVGGGKVDVGPIELIAETRRPA